MKVKTHKDCKYKCVNVKGGSGESKRLTQDLSHGIGTHLATPLVHIVEALTQEYLPDHQVYQGMWSPLPPHTVANNAPHQAGGSQTCRRATKAPRL